MTLREIKQLAVIYRRFWSVSDGHVHQNSAVFHSELLWRGWAWWPVIVSPTHSRGLNSLREALFGVLGLFSEERKGFALYTFLLTSINLRPKRGLCRTHVIVF
jgi:hypothetical protein